MELCKGREHIPLMCGWSFLQEKRLWGVFMIDLAQLWSSNQGPKAAHSTCIPSTVSTVHVACLGALLQEAPLELDRDLQPPGQSSRVARSTGVMRFTRFTRFTAGFALKTPSYRRYLACLPHALVLKGLDTMMMVTCGKKGENDGR